MNEFQVIIDALADVVFVHHPETGEIEYINKTCVQFYGYSAKELISKGLQLIVADEKGFDFKKQLSNIKKAAKGEVLTFEWKTKKASGELFWEEVVLKRAVFNKKIKVVATVRDITSQIEAKKVFRERELLLDSINQNISDGIYRSIPEGKFVYVNHAFVRIFGYDTVEEVLKIKPNLLYANPDSRNEIADSVNADEEIINKVIEFRRKDGSTFWGSMSSNLIIDSHGNKVFNGVVKDITKQRESEQKIEESQRILESINRNISEGLYRSYAKGGLIYVNDAFAKMFGYHSVDEILNVKSLALYANPEDRKDLTQNVIKQGSLINIETHFKRKDGSTFWGLNSAIHCTDHDGNEIFDGAVRDITDEKKAAEKLKALNDELLERNFELDQLVYKTSHDLRSPLRSVLGLTNLMKIENPEIKKEYFDRIDDRILKMDEFIKSMLDFSRANRLDLKNEVVNFSDIITSSITDLEYLDGFRDFKIIENYNGNLKRVKIDKLRLSIVFSNLISNAFKYRNKKAKLSFLKINVSYTNRLLLIVFEDNGIGIAKKYLNNVFDMFFRATEKSDGSGLGMYIVKQAVDKLNGTVTIDSKLKVGTTVTIKIP